MSDEYVSGQAGKDISGDCVQSCVSHRSRGESLAQVLCKCTVQVTFWPLINSAAAQYTQRTSVRATASLSLQIFMQLLIHANINAVTTMIALLILLARQSGCDDNYYVWLYTTPPVSAWDRRVDWWTGRKTDWRGVLSTRDEVNENKWTCLVTSCSGALRKQRLCDIMFTSQRTKVTI